MDHLVKCTKMEDKWSLCINDIKIVIEVIFSCRVLPLHQWVWLIIKAWLRFCIEKALEMEIKFNNKISGHHIIKY